MFLILLKLSILSISLSLLVIASPGVNLKNIAVARLITFSSEFVKIKAEIDVQNTHETPAINYEFYIDPDVDIYHIKFFDKYENPLNYTRSPNKNIYTITFSEPLRHLEQTSIIVKQIHVNKLKSCYKTRKLNQENIMRYLGNVKYYSKYETLAAAAQYYTTKMSFLNDSYSINPTSFANKSISYMFANIPPFSNENLNINFLSGINYYRILNMDRTVDISMYGMIEIVDNVILKNNGPKLVGPFEPTLARDNTVFSTPLPYGAKFIKYYDEIGLIQSYELNYYKDDVSLDLKPRFPLHGGWKVSYSLKYLIPIYNNVMYSKDNGFLELKIPAFGHVLKNVLIEKATVKILLPEGSIVHSVKADDELIRRGNRKVFSALSYSGRKQIEFVGRNVLDKYQMDIVIRFKQCVFYFLRAPLLIISHLFVVFMLVIFAYRYKSFGSKN